PVFSVLSSLCLCVSVVQSLRETGMADDTKKIDPAWAWEAYKPSAKAPWDLRRVGHLLRRTTFGATVGELQAAHKSGPEKAIAGLVAGGVGLVECDQRMALLA